MNPNLSNAPKQQPLFPPPLTQVEVPTIAGQICSGCWEYSSRCFNQHHQIHQIHRRLNKEGTLPTSCTFYTFWIPTLLHSYHNATLLRCSCTLANPKSFVDFWILTLNLLPTQLAAEASLLTRGWNALEPSRLFSLGIIGNNNSPQGGRRVAMQTKHKYAKLILRKILTPSTTPPLSPGGFQHYVTLTLRDTDIT